ncbi:MAG: hypothetical protein HS116_11570 [Planctomycetes bacterium]|nr:hypothetical protein [Planctomycetota bacterium]
MKMDTAPRSRLRIGASAAMVLATAVSAQAAAQDAPWTGPVQLDLSWAVSGGATHAARGTRSALARQAAETIHTLDRLTAPQRQNPTAQTGPVTTIRLNERAETSAPRTAWQDPSHGSRQTSAP